ncbi:MAG: carboxylating nicotinate-nucleotide diphosphorylase [Candidatus Aminicenantes bacterium]|nr:carboxylating nicotinate-nucleotide diphosphorylase [Candidatus Aminicenantes bacterium]
MLPEGTDRLIDLALAEDLPAGDVTTDCVVPDGALSKAAFTAKAEGLLAGIDVAARVFERVDSRVRFDPLTADGRAVACGEVLARVEGPAAAILKAERTALNFLQRLSGIASATGAYVRAVAGTKARILDTRKTTPGWRALEKYAVRMGGGVNHRMSLSDMILVKDNHIALAGSVDEALRRVRAKAPAGLTVEVEVRSLDQAKSAVEGGATMIMLDNMDAKDMRRVVAWVAGRVPVEASGGMSLERVGEAARLGVDYISVGALTHSFRSLDISLDFEG